MKFPSSFLSLLLTPLMAVMPLSAEFADGPADPAAAAVRMLAEASVPGASSPNGQATALQIRLADAASAVVEANSSQTTYSILVTDSSGLPVSGAAVAMRLPEEGATGFFLNGIHSAVAYTDPTGIAKFTQVHWSSTLGVANVMVTAVKGDLHAGALIEQTIVQHVAAAPIAAAPAAKIVATNAVPASPLSAPPAPIPGTLTSVAAVHTALAGDPNPAPAGKTIASEEPVVSVVNSPGTTGGSSAHGSNKKWILLAVVAVGAGVGAALALGLSGKGAAVVAGSSSGVSIGTPSVSVGH